MEVQLDAEVDDFWSALTERDGLRGWLGEIDGDLRPGGEFRAYFFASGREGTGRIDMCRPPGRLVVWTKDEDQPDEKSVDVTLTSDGSRTVLVWEESGIPVDLLWAYGSGIQMHVGDLVDHVAAGERRDVGPRFDALEPSYKQLAVVE